MSRVSHKIKLAITPQRVSIFAPNFAQVIFRPYCQVIIILSYHALPQKCRHIQRKHFIWIRFQKKRNSTNVLWSHKSEMLTDINPILAPFSSVLWWAMQRHTQFPSRCNKFHAAAGFEIKVTYSAFCLYVYFWNFCSLWKLPWCHSVHPMISKATVTSIWGQGAMFTPYEALYHRTSIFAWSFGHTIYIIMCLCVTPTDRPTDWPTDRPITHQTAGLLTDLN